MNEPTGDARYQAWDLPARVCHWGFAASMLAALWIGFRQDPRGEWFKYHMPLGLLAGWFLAVRIVLGFCGCALSRWGASRYPPQTFLRYFRTVLRGQTEEPPGLNPGTALFAPAVYLACFGLLVSGFLQEWVEVWHEPLAWFAVGLIAAHLLGLTLHALRHRAPTPLAMVHGRRQVAAGMASVPTRRGWGIALVVVSLLLAIFAWRYFDPGTSILALPFLPELQLPLIQRG